jgi:hypothetical protein
MFRLRSLCCRALRRIQKLQNPNRARCSHCRDVADQFEFPRLRIAKAAKQLAMANAKLCRDRADCK